MGSGLIITIVVAALAVFGVLAFISYKREQARQAALATFAGQHGFSLVEEDDSLIGRWGDADPFDKGFDKECTSIMTGTWDGRPAVLFDYCYHTWETHTDSEGHTTQTKQAHRLAITAVQTERRFPPLSVRPEGMIGRFFGRLTNTDIQLEWEDFNRAFTVNCPDRRFASDVLTQQMMELLMQDQDLAWQITGPDILTLRSGVHDPARLEATLSELDRILDTVPEHVKQTDWSAS
jgi:Protein of unknown function (DUF3137)